MVGGSRRTWWHRILRTLQAGGARGGERRRPRFTPRVEALEGRCTPATVTLTPVADNTLYQVSSSDPATQLSNGAGQHFFVGETSSGFNPIRRAAIRFDLSSVPAGSAI